MWREVHSIWFACMNMCVWWCMCFSFCMYMGIHVWGYIFTCVCSHVEAQSWCFSVTHLFYWGVSSMEPIPIWYASLTSQLAWRNPHSLPSEALITGRQPYLPGFQWKLEVWTLIFMLGEQVFQPRTHIPPALIIWFLLAELIYDIYMELIMVNHFIISWINPEYL